MSYRSLRSNDSETWAECHFCRHGQSCATRRAGNRWPVLQQRTASPPPTNSNTESANFRPEIPRDLKVSLALYNASCYSCLNETPVLKHTSQRLVTLSIREFEEDGDERRLREGKSNRRVYGFTWMK